MRCFAENICSLLGGIALPTLYKYYREELDTAMVFLAARTEGKGIAQGTRETVSG